MPAARQHAPERLTREELSSPSPIPGAARSTSQSRWRSIKYAVHPTAPTAAHIESASRKSITFAPVGTRSNASCPEHQLYPGMRARNAE